MSAKDMFYPEGKDFSNAEERAFARERLVYNVTEDILVALEDRGVSKKELARRLGKSRSYVTQILSGARNMTLGSLSDICFALNIVPELNFVTENEFGIHEISKEYSWTNVETKRNDLIKKSENVIDCTNHPKWVTQSKPDQVSVVQAAL